MAENTSISLDEHFTDFLSQEVTSGRYRSASEVVLLGDEHCPMHRGPATILQSVCPTESR